MLQPKRREQLDANIKELLANGGTNADIEKLAQDFTAKFDQPLKKKESSESTSTTQNGSVDSVQSNGSLDFQLPKYGADLIVEASKQVAGKVIPTAPKESYAKITFKKAKSEVDNNLTEERLLEEKNQSGFVNNLGKVGKTLWNVTGTGLSSVNEMLGGSKDYFTIDDYKPLQDEKKQAKKELEKEGLPITNDAVQKKAEFIFRKNDKLQQLQKRLDANLPEGYDKEGIWKELKLENLKKNDALKQSVISAEAYRSQLTEFDKYYNSLKNIPKEEVSPQQIEKYNELLEDATESIEGLKYLEQKFPEILKEVKTSDELLDVFKYNYNDYEKAFSNIKNFAKTLAGGTVKLATESLDYVDEKLGNETGKVPVRQMLKEISNEVLDEASAEREQFIKYKAKDISNFSDVGSFMTELSTNQLPVWATLVVAPEMGTVLLGTSQGGEQFRNMEKEEKQPFSQQTSFGQKLATSYMYGGAETLFERLGTVSILKNIEKTIARASNPSRRLIQDGAMKEASKLGKQFGYNFGLEGGTEYLTAEAQIGADRYIANKNISSQQANERRSESFLAGGIMGGGMTMVGGVWGGIAQKAKLYSDNKDVQKTKEILSQIESLSNEVKNNPNLTKQEKVLIYKKMDELTNQSFEIVSKNANREKDFNDKEKQFLVDVTVKQEEIKNKFKEIKDSNFSKEQKEMFASELKNQYKKLEEDRITTLDGKFSEIADDRKTITFEKQKEDNLQDDAEAKIPTPETKSEAEVQEPTAEAEKPKEVIVDEGKENGNITNDGVVGLADNPSGENTASEQQVIEPKSVPEAIDGGASENDVEVNPKVKHAVEQIDKGVLNWSGDMGSPRIDLGMSWADIRKGEKDLKAGKTETAPAKRLVEALDKAKEEGGYHYKYGTGGESARAKEFVPFEDIERSLNEHNLTDAEIEDVNKNQDALTKEYYDHFAKLDENSQNEILDNYETDKSTEIGENPQSENSGTNVSDKKEGSNRESESESKKLGVSDKDYTELRDFVKDIPESGVIKNYLSGKTIEREYSKPTNDQQYDVKGDDLLRQHGLNIVNKFIELFGNDYIEKGISFLEGSNLNVAEKGIAYATLENNINEKVLENPNNTDLLRQQELVNKYSQANLNIASTGIRTGRLRALFNAIKEGIDIDKYRNQLFNSKEKEAKSVLEETFEDIFNKINKEEDSNPNGEDFEFEQPQQKRGKKEVKADLKVALQDLKKALTKTSFDKLQVSIPYAEQVINATPHILKVGRLLTELGGLTAKEIADFVYNEVKKSFPKVEKKDIVDILKEKTEEEKRTIELNQKINKAKKQIADLESNKPPKSNEGKSSAWSKELSDLKNKLEELRKDKKENSPIELVKKSLIDAGYFREVNYKGEKVKRLDWTKLAGVEGTVEKIKETVEKSLKEKGFSDLDIAKMNDALTQEYKRLSTDILNKSTAELERRNLIKPSPNRKTDNEKLVDLYNMGLFGENQTQYENLMNKTIGLSSLQSDNYQKIKELVKALSDTHKVKVDGKKYDESTLRTISNDINHKIKELISVTAFKEGNKKYKTVASIGELIGLSHKAILLNLPNMLENAFSGKKQKELTKIQYRDILTPELLKQIDQNSKTVFKDLVNSDGLFYGDTNTSLASNTMFDDLVRRKVKNKAIHSLISIMNGNLALDGLDSRFKVALTDMHFVANAVDLLTTKKGEEKPMSKEDAIKTVSESLTGDNFQKAKETAKDIIDKVNSLQDKKQLRDSEEAIHRLAMDLVKENLLAENHLTMDEIKDSFAQAYKSAGRDIGHVANNMISEMVNNQSAKLNSRIEEAIKEKDWNLASMETLKSIVQNNVINPFAGGGGNWVVLSLEHSGNPVGFISTLYNKSKSKELDLTTDIGIKKRAEALYRKRNLQSSVVRNLFGTATALAIYGASQIGKDDDELKDKLNNWLDKNEWAKRYFNKLSPEALTFIIAKENKELGKHYARLINMKTSDFDETYKTIQALNGEDGNVSGNAGALLGSLYSTPFSWRAIRDINNVVRGLKGLPENKTDYNATTFLNGYFRGGLADALKLRPNQNYNLSSKKQDILNKAKDTNKQIDNIVNKLYDKSMTEEQAIEKLKTLYKDKPEDAKKGIDAVKNRFEDKKIKEEVTDSWYLDFKREQNKDVKAMMFYDKFQKFYENPQKVSKAEREEAEKNLKLLNFKPDNEFMQKVYRYIAENKKAPTN